MQYPMKDAQPACSAPEFADRIASSPGLMKSGLSMTHSKADFPLPRCLMQRYPEFRQMDHHRITLDRISRLVLTIGIGAIGILSPLVSFAGEQPSLALKSLPNSATLFENTRPALTGLRTLLRATGKQYAAGSAFFVDREGHAITNFHVVADSLLDPHSYTLEYRSSDGVAGKARVLAFDAINDLAVVALEGKHRASLNMSLLRPTQHLKKGDALHSIGNPLDLGFTVTSGSYSGLVDGSPIGRIHYSGVLNPGMSGGPALDDSGQLVGVNVSKTLGSEMVSFLVPIERARDLYRHALSQPPLREGEARAEITRQLVAHQQRIVDMAFAQPWKSVTHGAYRAPEFLTDISDCGSSSNHNSVSPPPVLVQATACTIKEIAHVQRGVLGGYVDYRNTYLETRTLNSFLFSRHVDGKLRVDLTGSPSDVRGRQLCRDNFVSIGREGKLPARLIWCSQAIRGYPGLYDFDVSIATQDRSDRALVTHLFVSGFTWKNGQRLTRRLLEEMQ